MRLVQLRTDANGNPFRPSAKRCDLDTGGGVRRTGAILPECDAQRCAGCRIFRHRAIQALRQITVDPLNRTLDADESFFPMGCREHRSPLRPRTRLHSNDPLVHELQQNRVRRSTTFVTDPSIAGSPVLRATAESDTKSATSVSYPGSNAATGNGGTSQ